MNHEVKIEMPGQVKDILNTLASAGYEAYAVGGCVRDSILGRKPHDWDITTNALPEQVKGLFRRTIDTGIAHGTVTIMIREEGYEVTTYRVDGDYSDGRHPDSVEFSSSLEEDLKRRDFTINAMAYNDTDGLVDLFGGMSDLCNHIVRCVGIAEERFTEDALRLLRAVRFSAQLGFVIEENTADAVRKLAPTIHKVSRERIHTELGKILCSKNPHYIELARELGLMDVIIPEFGELSDYRINELVLQELGGCTEQEADLGFRYSAMLYPLSEQKVKKILRELKLDNMTIDTATVIARGVAGCTAKTTDADTRIQASPYGSDMYGRIVQLCERIARVKDRLGIGEPGRAEAWQEEAVRIAKIAGQGDPLSVKELAVTGNDLIALGVSPGRQLGAILQALLQLVLEDPMKNDRAILLEEARKQF